MSNYNIEIDLSSDGIQELIDDLSFLTNNLPKVSELFIKYSLDYIESLAKENIDATTGGSSWYRVTGNLKHSFMKSYSSFYGELINYALYACYVEYGTGIYADNGQGRKGGWLFKDKDGIVRFTKGTKPHWFMQNAYERYYLAGEYKIIWDKAFDEIMGGILK